MYETLARAIKGEIVESEIETLEDAYNKLYTYVSRVLDMDDFTTPMLRKINELAKTKPFKEAFKIVIDSDYEFYNFDYIEEAFDYVKESNIKQALDRAVASRSPSVTWSNDIFWFANHLTIDFDGNQYTIQDLQRRIGEE